MNNMRIVEIPASMRENAGRKNTVRKLRVAAYCRVSTEEEEQQGSFEIQKLYYTEKINSTPEWEVAGIYADDGISGVHTKKRDGFNQMIQDCKKRKIDLILTKSISRFARNTLDSIPVSYTHLGHSSAADSLYKNSRDGQTCPRSIRLIYCADVSTFAARDS